ncbi:uncharacterized protein PG986_009930 [Apiospora aurea]|uniref:Uncharacterized protein n=1 Tax=Apiospora aurea TaxID=335848 RepID=A0ABR1Q937_9PEZI
MSSPNIKAIFANASEEELRKEWRISLLLTLSCRIAVFRQAHPKTSRSPVWRTATESFEQELDELDHTRDTAKAREVMSKVLKAAQETALSMAE